MLFKRIFLFNVFFNITLFIFSEYLILKDGSIFYGKLLSFNKDNILLEINSKSLEFSFNLVDYFIHNNIQEKDLILYIEKKNNIKEKLILIKATSNALFYKIPNKNDINIILLSNINSIKTNNLIKNKINIEKYNIQIIDDINTEIDYLIELLNYKKNKTAILNNKDFKNSINPPYIFLNINDLDFYEKYWEKINNYTKDNTKNLIWNLFELYSNKEKYLNLIYGNNIKDSKDVNDNSLENINDDNTGIKNLNEKFIKLRYEFYCRAKKIIYNLELLIN